MQRTSRLLALVGLVTFLGALILQLPARVVLPLAGLGPAVASGVSGTIWHGTARSATVAGRVLGPVAWQLRPLQLLRGTIAADVDGKLPGGFVTGRLGVGLGGGFRAGNLEITVPLAVLVPGAAGVGPDSQLSARISALVMAADGRILRAVGTLQTAGVALPLPGPAAGMATGSYRLEFAADDLPPDQPLTGALTDTGGPMALEATARFMPPRSYEIEGTARARPDSPPELAQALQMLGPPTADGARQFSLAGSF